MRRYTQDYRFVLFVYIPLPSSLCTWYRNRRKRQHKTAPIGPLERSEKAKRRKVKTNVFKFPAAASSPESLTYSVCTSTNLFRVAVVDIGGVMTCSRSSCNKRWVEHARIVLAKPCHALAGSESWRALRLVRAATSGGCEMGAQPCGIKWEQNVQNSRK